MTYQNLLMKHEGPYVWITLNRPKANALSLALIQELREAVESADMDPAVRVILITGGSGRFFAAGADIPGIVAVLDDPMADGTLLPEGIRTMDRIAACSKPVVAVVNGMALGGGCELCLACHLRIAAETAVFGQPEINLGIIPCWGGTYRLPMAIGESRAREWLLTGRSVSAAEAFHAGLVNQVVPEEELEEAARKLALELAGKPAVAIRAILESVHGRGFRPDHGPALEKMGFEAAARSVDAAEGIQAFIEKRKPNFTGERGNQCDG